MDRRNTDKMTGVLLLLVRNKPKRSIRKEEKKPMLKGWRRFRTLLTWLIFLLFLATFAFLRYGKENLFPAPELLLSDFQDGAYEMTPESSFVIPFSQRMNKESVISALEIAPEEEFTEYWEGKTLYLEPTTPLLKGDEYTIFITKEAKSFMGMNLQRNAELSYRVGDDPHILAIYPGEEEIDTKDHIAILFSHPMISETEVLENQQPGFISISPRIPGEWRWHNKKTLVFHQRGFLPASTEFRIQSDETLITRDGSELEDEIEAVFRSKRITLNESKDPVPVLEVTEGYQVSFSIAVKSSEIEDHLSILEESGKKVPFSVSSHDDGKKFFIQPKESKWLYDEKYRVIISDELLPRDGNLGLAEAHERSFQTEHFLSIDEDFSRDGIIFLNKERKSFTFQTKEEITKEELEAAISFIPERNFMINKNAEDLTILFKDFSRGAKKMTFFITEEINPEDRRIISHPIQYEVALAPALQTTFSEDERSICLLSNNKLQKKTHVLIDRDNNEVSKRFELDDKDQCQSEKSYSYRYVLNKSFLEPGIKAMAHLKIWDIYGEKREEELTLRTDRISREDITLQRKSQLFYLQASSTDELLFEYETKNLNNVIAVVCKVSGKKAIQIEGSFEKKWFSFEPAPEKCLRYKSVRESFDPKWGILQTHTFDLRSAIGEKNIDTGLYYIHLHAPGYTNGRGEPIETNGVIQLSQWEMFSKRGKSSLVWLIDSKSKSGIANASLSFISNDGINLEVKQTDENGLYFSPRNKLKYDFLLAKKGTEELLLNVFAQEGFEPARFPMARIS